MKKEASTIESKILSLINKIRPFIVNDGGDIKFISYKDNIVYIKLSGACENCSMVDITLKNGIEDILKNEIPEIEKVVNID
ncbi:MAG: NifU family protein [Bacilli bacterium]|nr:NifU family protein [Bacilli bacterium]